MIASKTKKLLVFGLFSYLILWQLVVVAQLVEPIIKGEAFCFPDHFGEYTAIDFVRFYAAGRLASESNSLNIYDMSEHLKLANEICGAGKLLHYFYIPYPPTVFAAMIPLSQLPILPAYLIWLLGSLSLGLTSLALMLRNNGASNLEIAAFALACAGSWPSAFVLREGQITWFFVAIICTLFSSMKCSSSWRSGILLVLTTIKPQWFLYCLAAQVGRKQFKQISMAAIIGLAVLVITALAVGLPNLMQYPYILATIDTNLNAGGFPEQMISLRGLLTLIMPNHAALQTSFFLLIPALLMVAFIWSAKTVQDGEGYRWAAALTIVLSLIVNPHCSPQDAVLIAIPAALTWPEVRAPWHTKSDCLRAWSVVMLSYPLTSWLVGPQPPGYKLGFLLMHVYLAACALMHLRRLSQARAERSN